MKFPPIVKNNREPEYKRTPPLPISSVGTNNTKKSTQMPDGSALLTDAGNNSSLKSQGIKHIIHAVPRPRGSSASDQEFVEIAAKAAQNSIILAEREGIKKLAICFIGGKIYRGSCDPLKLAEAVVTGALNQVAECQKLEKVIFVSLPEEYPENSGIKRCWMTEVYNTIKSSGEYSKGISKTRAVDGDICKFSTHGAGAIVNSENAGMGWGGGISGAICKALGGEGSKEANNVDQQRKKWMEEFNKIINQEEGNGNSDKITWQGRYESQGTNTLISGQFFYFVSSGVEDHPFLPREFTLSVSLDHPIFEGNPPILNQEYKFSYKKAGNENKSCFRKGDFIEVEGIGNPDQNKPPKCTFCSKTFPAGSGIIYNNKDYCSNDCSLKQQEKDAKEPKKCAGCGKVLDATKQSIFFKGESWCCSKSCLEKQNQPNPKPGDGLAQVRTSAISDIQQALNSEPKLTNSDLLSDYQNWESIIKKLNSESEINDLKEKVLNDIKIKRKNKQESATRDQKINQAQTEEEKINLLGEIGASLGEITSEQKDKLEKIKDDLAADPVKLQKGIQKEITAWMTACEVQKDDLDSETKNQLEKLENENDPNKIRALEKQINQEIGKKGVNKKINSLAQEVAAVLKNKQETKIQELREKLLEYISSPNSFYQQQKSQFQALLQKLEGTQKQNPNQTSNKPESPWKLIIPISLAVIVGVVGTIIIFRKNQRKLNRK